MPAEAMYETPPRKVNHRVQERYLCARVKAGEDIHPEDLVYLCDRIIALREQLDNERDAADAELALRQERMQLEAMDRRDEEASMAP
jgi:hypothetical protein